MAKKLRTYSPKAVDVIVGGVKMEGWSEGSMIDISYNADTYTLSIGVAGQGSRAQNDDLSARITIHLAQTSPSNDALSGFWLADGEAPNGVPVPLMIKDRSGRSLYVAESAWATKIPDGSFNNGINERAWVIETDRLVPFVGGNDTQ